MSRILNQLSALNDALNRPDSDGREPADLEALTARVLELKPTAAQHVAELGALLKRIKAHLGHGSFVAWLGDSAGMTRSTATKYMRAAELPNIDALESLGVEKLYLLRALDNVEHLHPNSTLPIGPDRTHKTLTEMSTRELRGAVQALAPGRPTRRPMRRDLVQRYLHLREEIAQIADQLNNGDSAARVRFERQTGHPVHRAAEIARMLP